jgi:hypothetical protein
MYFQLAYYCYCVIWDLALCYLENGFGAGWSHVSIIDEQRCRQMSRTWLCLFDVFVYSRQQEQIMPNQIFFCWQMVVCVLELDTGTCWRAWKLTPLQKHSTNKNIFFASTAPAPFTLCLTFSWHLHTHTTMRPLNLSITVPSQHTHRTPATMCMESFESHMSDIDDPM